MHAADENEMRIFDRECRTLVQRTVGTRLGITRGLHVGLVNVRPHKQIVFNPGFEREIKLVKL